MDEKNQLFTATNTNKYSKRIKSYEAIKSINKKQQSISSDLQEKQQEERYRILTWSEIPEWMRFNPYILSGYRPPNDSYITCIKSILKLHNESCKST